MMPGRIRRRLRSVLHRTRVERELDLELQFHLDMLTAQHARAGLPPAAARRAARQAFGTVAGIKDDVRDVWLGGRIDAAMEDVRYGVRTLRACRISAASGDAVATSGRPRGPSARGVRRSSPGSIWKGHCARRCCFSRPRRHSCC